MTKCDPMALDSDWKPLFEAAYRAHHRTLIHYLRRRLGSDTEAHDVAQEAYVRLLHYREKLAQASLKALVFRIARNLLITRFRSSRAIPAHEPLEAAAELSSDAASVESQLGAQQQLLHLLEVVRHLPPKCRRTFVLSRFHNLDYREIATRQGISVKMVEKHIAHALVVCRRAVGDEWP